MTFVLGLARDTVVLPVAPVAIGVAIAASTRSAVAQRAVGAIAMAAGITLAHFIDIGIPRWPPVDTIGWIPVAAVVALLGLLADGRLPARVVAAFVVTSAATWLIGRPAWTISESVPRVLLAAVIASAIVASFEIANRRMPTVALLLAFAMTAASAAIACLVDRSALLGEVLGASAVVVGASALVALRFDLAKTTANVAVVSTITVVIYARVYATLSVRALLLLGASASAPLIACLLPLTRRVRSIACVVLAVALGVIAVLVTT